jgi:hypothetical protein
MAIEAQTIEEFDHLLAGDPAGLATHQDNNALEDRIQEWLETPEGTIADLPWWGNRLGAIKHEPQGVSLQVKAEMSIVEKLPLDVRNVQVKGILVENMEIDMVRVVVQYQLGTFVGEVVL